MKSLSTVLTILILLFGKISMGQDTEALEGRWNLIISQEGKELPAWLEISHSGTGTLVGRFTYAFGSARPISEVKLFEDTFYFRIPPQWEPGAADMEFTGKLVGPRAIAGTMVYADGNTYPWKERPLPHCPITRRPSGVRKSHCSTGKT